LPNRLRAPLSALFFCCAWAHAQTIAFEIQTYPDSPIVLVNYTPSAFRIENDRRQFLTVKNASDKSAVAMLFQQAISRGSKTEIVSLERVSTTIRPRETRRLSVSVGDVWTRTQTAGKSGETVSKPVLSVVAVEFTDGSTWSAPSDRTQK
jgi:hypothetical protein